MVNNAPHNALRHYVSGAVARGEAVPIVGIDDEEYYEHCPACGEPIDYCQGHGFIGDAAGWCILTDHDNGEHFGCDPRGCDDA